MPATTEHAPINLSVPHMSGRERALVEEAFDTNWIGPVGPHVDAFEEEFAEAVGSPHAVAVSSGTAALHLALRLVGVSKGDEVLAPTFTFCASVNPARYLGARPTFIDSERSSWTLDLNRLEDVLATRAEAGALPAAVVAVHIYGQCADLEAIGKLCARYEVPLVEDAAEALGSTCRGRSAGTAGAVGTFSFNGNKIITCGGGGMLVTEDAEKARRARKLATQAREPAPHYQHTEIGYNYRLSNVLAGIGRGQLEVLEKRVAARRRIFARYRKHLADVPGLSFMPEAPWCRHNRWLTCLTIDPEAFGASREDVRLALESERIASRPTWKPMHLQPVYEGYPCVGGGVAEELFERGLCLPSGSSMDRQDVARVADAVRSAARA